MSPRLCVITALRNCAPLVPIFTRMVDSFELRPSRIVIGVNDSTDETEILLREWAHPALDLFAFSAGAPEYPRVASDDPDAQNESCKLRSAHLAALRNRVIDRALIHQDWDVALMQDAGKLTSPDLPGKLAEDEADIVAPLSWYCRMPARFYDIWCYRDIVGNPFPFWLPAEILGTQRLVVSAVGGVYTVKRRVFEDGCRLAGTNGDHCDSVPFCDQARTRGYSIVVRTDLGVTAYDYPNNLPKLGAINAWLPAGDYVSPGMTIVRPDQVFPNMMVGDTDACDWPYLRRELPHNWYVDSRAPGIGFLNRDEVHILYNTALQFKGKRGLEIGCWLGWSACHLGLAGLSLDVVDPALEDEAVLDAVRISLHAAGVLGTINLVPGRSPESVEALARTGDSSATIPLVSEEVVPAGARAGSAPRKWSFVFIDGDHEAPSPLLDAQVCESLLEDDALVMFHDLAAPAVAEGLSYFRSRGWQTMIYQTTPDHGGGLAGQRRAGQTLSRPESVLATPAGPPPGLCSLPGGKLKRLFPSLDSIALRSTEHSR